MVCSSCVCGALSTPGAAGHTPPASRALWARSATLKGRCSLCQTVARPHLPLAGRLLLHVGDGVSGCLPAVPAVLQERLFDQSDAYRVHVCTQCGLIAVANLRKNQFYCPACKNTTGIVQAST